MQLFGVLDVSDAGTRRGDDCRWQPTGACHAMHHGLLKSAWLSTAQHHTTPLEGPATLKQVHMLETLYTTTVSRPPVGPLSRVTAAQSVPSYSVEDKVHNLAKLYNEVTHGF